jgi:hypothetical protein
MSIVDSPFPSAGEPWMHVALACPVTTRTQHPDRSDPAVAKDWREAVREVLAPLLAEGAAVTGFDRAGWYVLTRRHETARGTAR